MYRVWLRNSKDAWTVKTQIEGFGVPSDWVQVVEEGEPMWVEAAMTTDQKLKASLDPMVNR